MAVVYVDTNIYLDYFLKRKAKTNFSEAAFNLFKRTILCEFKIVVSDHLLSELKNNIQPEQASFLFKMIKPKIIKVERNEEDDEKARKLNTDFSDALYIVLAEKGRAKIIVTRNIRHFYELFNAKLPENI